MKQFEFSAFLSIAVAAAALVAGGGAQADESVAPAASAASHAPSKHELMKECMAKEKAADSGRPSYELSADCKDITKTEKQNADAQAKQPQEKASQE